MAPPYPQTARPAGPSRPFPGRGKAIGTGPEWVGPAAGGGGADPDTERLLWAAVRQEQSVLIGEAGVGKTAIVEGIA